MQKIAPPPTLAEAFSDLLNQTAQRVSDGVRSPATLTMQEAHARWWSNQLGADRRIDEIDEVLLEMLATRPRARPKHCTRTAGPETLRKRLSTLRAAMRLECRRRKIPRVPEFPQVLTPRPPSPQVLANYRDAVRLYESLPLHRARWYWLAVWTGQRASDVERMTWNDIDLPARTMIIRSTKTRPRSPGLKVRIPEPLYRVLVEMKADPAQPADGRLVRPWPSRKTTLPLHCQRCGLPKLNATALRHSNLSWIASVAGISPALARWSGHTSTRMLEETYVQALPAQLLGLTDALDSFAKAKPANDNAGGEPT